MTDTPAIRTPAGAKKEAGEEATAQNEREAVANQPVVPVEATMPVPNIPEPETPAQKLAAKRDDAEPEPIPRPYSEAMTPEQEQALKAHGLYDDIVAKENTEVVVAEPPAEPKA